MNDNFKNELINKLSNIGIIIDNKELEQTYNIYNIVLTYIIECIDSEYKLSHKEEFDIKPNSFDHFYLDLLI